MPDFKVLLISLIAATLLSSCTKYIFKKGYNLSLDNLRIDSIIISEARKKSVEIPDKHFTIGKDIYPNEKRFILEDPMVFNSIESPYFKCETDYYYTKDGLVKVILYQWDTLPNQDEGFIIENHLPNAKVFKAKYDHIAKDIIKILGKPSSTDNDGTFSSDSFRVGLKWNSKYSKAYLFMLGNKSGYREIRLAVYN